MTLPFIEKYRAQSFDSIKGQESVISQLKDFYHNFPKKKAMILNGPVGTGKTSLVLALAKEFNVELFELNASDLRNRVSLEEVLKPVTDQLSLFKKGKIILMDEADGITGSDRGGLPELIRLIVNSHFPIIITANDIWHKKFSPLRQKCSIIQLKELSNSIVLSLLQEISRKEHMQISDVALSSIAKQVRGDMRAALNDLQSLIVLEEYNGDDIQAIREKEESIFTILKNIFQEPFSAQSIRAFDNTSLDLNEISLWIEENIPLAYSGKVLAKSYHALSMADLFKGRIYRQQHWRFLVYQNFFLSAGIASVTQLKKKQFIPYKRPTRILKIWLSNQKNAKKNSILTKFAYQTHMSKRKAKREAFFLPFIIDDIAQKKLDLDESEKKYLSEKKVDSIIVLGLNKFR
jgi:replication factor C large subunit